MILYNISETTYGRQSTSWLTMMLVTVEVGERKAMSKSAGEPLVEAHGPPRNVAASWAFQ